MEPIVFSAVMTKEGATRWNNLRKSISDFWTPKSKPSWEERAYNWGGHATLVGGLGLGAGLGRLGHVVGDLYRKNPDFQRKIHNIGLGPEHMGPIEQALKNKGVDVAIGGVTSGAGSIWQSSLMKQDRLRLDRLRKFRNRSAVGGGALGVGGLGLSGYAVMKD